MWDTPVGGNQESEKGGFGTEWRRHLGLNECSWAKKMESRDVVRGI